MLAGYLVLLLASVLAICGLTPPEVVPASAPATEFSAERALAELREIAAKPHPIGSAEHTEVQRKIVATLLRLGLRPELQKTTAVTETVGLTRAARVANIAARIPGTEPTRAVMLSAHYDSVAQSRGASDDGAGVVTLLETARALMASARLRNDVIFLFTDSEEEFLLGASAFASEHPWAKDVALDLNFEARGSHGPSAMFQTSGENGFLIRGLAEAAPRPVANSAVSSLSRVLPNDTDLLALKSAGMVGMDFAFAGGLARYHTFQDSAENLDPRSLQHHGSYALSLARYFGDQDLTGPLAAPSPVYFDLLGRWLVRYPTWVALVLSAGVGIFFVFLFNRDRPTLRFRNGIKVSLLALATPAAALAALTWIVGRLASGSLLLAHEDALVLPLLVFALGVLALTLDRTEWSWDELYWGALLPWLILSFLSALFFPGMSFIFQWPLLFSLLARLPRKRWLSFACLVPVTLFVMPFAYSVHTLESGALPALPVWLLLAALALLVPRQAKMPNGLARAGLLLTTLGALLTIGIALSLRHSAEKPKPAHLVHATDSAARLSYWISDLRMDAWTQGVLGLSPEHKPLPAFSPDDSPRTFSAAPFMDFKPPVFEILGEKKEAGSRQLEVRVRSQRGARCISLWEETGVPGIEAKIDGKPPRVSFRFSPELDKKLWHLISGGPTVSQWKFKYCVPGPEGFGLELRFKETEHPRFRVVDETPGLPSGAPARPAELSPDTWSDRTLVGTRVEL